MGTRSPGGATAVTRWPGSGHSGGAWVCLGAGPQREGTERKLEADSRSPPRFPARPLSRAQRLPRR